MKISSRFAGTPLKDYHTKISGRATANYAAAIADNNHLYFDDTRDRLPVAPPTFPVAVTWPVLSRLQDFISVKDFPVEVLFTQVHYTEHLVLHRLIRPEEELTIKGQVASIQPHRAGTHAVIELCAQDQNARPVFTEYIGAMLRGVECDTGQSRTSLPLVPEFNFSKTPAWTSKIFIDPLLPYIYDGCTNIEFPIHTSPKFARDVGLPGIILQGTCTLASAIREILIREASGSPEQINQIACKFTGMVKPGTHIEICCYKPGNHSEHRELFFEVLNAEKKKAIRTGYIKLKKEIS